MQGYVIELRRTVAEATPLLLALTDHASAHRPAPGVWSPRETLGHLIDSASNNHHRFILAQFRDDLVFAGYEQEEWVRVQHYRDAPWKELVALWQSYNLHLARVMEAAPEQVRMRERPKHNLYQIGWQIIAEDKPATLDYLMSDYVGHLKHHLRQILG
jgi:hypothetical protein